jgi:D-threo-aldose 1-dehydrogenase
MPFQPAYDYTYDGVLRSHEASLQRLGLARVNILFVHDIGRLTHGDSNATYWRQLNEGGGFKALQQLRNQGAIDAFGVGVNEIEACLEALEETSLDVVLLAGRYTLLEQEAMDELLPACSAANTSVIVGAPYNSGILASGIRADRAPHYNYGAAPQAVVERVARIERIADAHATPMAAAALQFPLAHPSVASVIPGQSGPEEVRATLSFFHHPIPRAFWEELRAEGLLRDDAPTPDRAN